MQHIIGTCSVCGGRVSPPGAPAPCVWRDIASAPKDGTAVLLFHKGAMEPDYVTVAEYVTFETSEHHYRSGWCSADAGQYGDDSGVPPTHWMPLPAPPQEDREP